MIELHGAYLAIHAPSAQVSAVIKDENRLKKPAGK
jgi:hypothetical protein